MADVHGDLSVMPLSDIVIWLSNRSMSGRLEVTRGGVQKRFEILDGRATGAASNDPREYFGQFLVHSGLLTEDQLQRAFQTQNETRVLLGRILVMIGIVPEELVIQTLREKVSETLLDAFRWREGSFRFETEARTEERPQIDLAIPLSVIHREGLARSEMWARYSRIVPDGRWLVHVNDDSPAAKAPPDTLPGRILSLARHGLTVEAITLDLHATDYQLASRLMDLYRDGAIVPQEPSGSLLPLSSSTVKAHVDKAWAAIRAEKYSEALGYVDQAAQVPGTSDDIADLKRELESRALNSVSQDLGREAVPILIRQPDANTLKRLSAKQRYVLARIDGNRNVEAIIQVSPMHDQEALQILRQFHADHLIQIQ